MTIGIYSILNKQTKKRYIGLSKNIEVRTFNHKWHLRNNKHKNIHLQRAWNKYGEKTFLFEILEVCSEYDSDNIAKLEKKYIKKYDSFVNGYNRSCGGDGMVGYIASPTTLEKLRQANIGNKHALGRKASEEERVKKSIAFSNRVGHKKHSERGRKTLKNLWQQEWFKERLYLVHMGNQHSKGMKRSDEFKQHLSEIRKGDKNPFYGKKHTDETKESISKKSKEMWQDEEFRENLIAKRNEIMQSDEYKMNMSIAMRGSNNGRAKMTEKEVLEIRFKKMNGSKLRELVNEYPQYTKRSIQKAYSGDTWKHLPLELEEVRSMLINYQTNSESVGRFND